MSNVTTFGATVDSIRRYLNPTFDPTGIQLGPLFTLTDVDPNIARLLDHSVQLDLGSIGLLGANQLEGYRLIVNDNYAVPLGIIGSSESDQDGFVIINVDSNLPDIEVDVNWKIVCQTTRVDFIPTDVTAEIKSAASFIRSKLKGDYLKMLTQITGFLLYPRDFLGYNISDSLVVQLPFWKAQNVGVWSDPTYDYAYRLTGGIPIKVADFSVAHDDTLQTSTITLGFTPGANAVIAVDFSHDLSPIPTTLDHAIHELVKARLIMRSASVRADHNIEMAKDIIASISDLVKNITEFDELELYRGTKRTNQDGYSTTRLMRG